MIGLGCSNINIDYARTPTPGLCEKDETVCVEVSCDFVPATPLIGNFFPSGSLTLLGRSEMRIEGIFED
jgi:hypothetical protein